MKLASVLLADNPPTAPSLDKHHNEPNAFSRHLGGANYTFCDGHAKWYKPEAIVISEYPIATGDNQMEMGAGNDGIHPTFMPWAVGERPDKYLNK